MGTNLAHILKFKNANTINYYITNACTFITNAYIPTKNAYIEKEANAEVTRKFCFVSIRKRIISTEF